MRCRRTGVVQGEGTKPGGDNAKATFTRQRRRACRPELRSERSEYHHRPDRWIDHGTQCAVDNAFSEFFRQDRHFILDQPDFSVRLCDNADHTSGVWDNIAGHHATLWIKRDHLQSDTLYKCHGSGRATQHYAEFGRCGA